MEEVEADAYLQSVSPEYLQSRPSTPSTMEAEIDGMIELDESSGDDYGGYGDDPGEPVHTLNDSFDNVESSGNSSSDSDVDAVIPRRELLALEARIHAEGQTPETSDDEPEAGNQQGTSSDARINFVLLQDTFEINGGNDEEDDEEDNFSPNWISGRTGYTSFRQRTLGKELLTTLLTRMLHQSSELFEVFVEKTNWRSNGGAGATTAFDENWPRDLTLSEMLLAYENAYTFISKQPEAKEIIEGYGYYHPSVFHTLGRRRIYFGQNFNRVPPQGTPVQNLWRDLQPVIPSYIPETPDPSVPEIPQIPIPETPENAPVPEVNSIPVDVGMQFELNLGLLNGQMEASNEANVEWAHGVIDIEDENDPDGMDLNEDPFEDPPGSKPQTYRRSLRSLLVRLILRADRVTKEKNRRLHFAASDPDQQNPHLSTQWFKNCGKRDIYAELLSRYDKLVEDTNFHAQHTVAAAAARAAADKEERDMHSNAARAHAAKLNANIRHYFSKCESGAVVVNYEYVGRRSNSLLGEKKLRELARLTALGACTADKCSCPGHCIPNEQTGQRKKKPWVQIEFTNGSTIGADELPELLSLSSNEPEVELTGNERGEIAAAAVLSDNDSVGDDEVFPIGQVITNVQAPSFINGRNLPRNADYYRTFDQFSDDDDFE